MRILVSLIFAISIVYSCTDKKNSINNDYNIGAITFTALPGMKLIEQNSIDSYAADLVDERGDIIFEGNPTTWKKK